MQMLIYFVVSNVGILAFGGMATFLDYPFWSATSQAD
jgi:hypothetical protein